MCLKFIKLVGFKLFVDLIIVLFLFNMMVVVGFNGCGKFNFLEVMCWVMGVNFVKVMCGGEMDDLIFFGVVGWLVCEFVEVMFVLDNFNCIVLFEFNSLDMFEIM